MILEGDPNGYLCGFKECTEEEWIDCEEGDRAMLEIDDGTTHIVYYFKKDAVYTEGEEE